MWANAVNCRDCKLLINQVFLDREGKRLCSDCFQKEFNYICENLNKAFEKLYVVKKKNEEMEAKIQIYNALFEQMRFTLELQENADSLS